MASKLHRQVDEYMKNIIDRKHTIIDVVDDCINEETGVILASYAEQVDRIRGKLNQSPFEIILSAVMLGYLLKTIINKIDLENLMREETEDER